MKNYYSGRNRIKKYDPAVTKKIVDEKWTQNELDVIWEQLPAYNKRELELSTVGEDYLPDNIKERQKERDEKIIERIQKERLQEAQEKGYEETADNMSEFEEIKRQKSKESLKRITLDEFYKTKREYPDEFIRLMSLHPLKTRLTLLKCFDCIKDFYRTKEIKKCLYNKNTKDEVEIELRSKCPCVQNHT